MSEHVLVERDGGVLTLTLNRPEKKNALTTEMYAALGAALEAAGRDDAVRCVLVRAAGDSFCAGNDLTEFVAVGGRPDAAWEGNPFLSALAAARKPLVAAVQGRAVGVGLTLLLHCDLVYLGDDALLSAPFVDLGLVPEAASTLTLPARVGHVRAFSLFVLGEVLPAGEAVAWGLANAVLPVAELDAHARAAAAEVARRTPAAVTTTKSLMREPEVLAERIAVEGEQFVARLRSPEAAEAFARLLRRPGPGS
ncbi:enoyl-CoA hydratase-related protein [Georgenia sp. TF02-10]|uniref:enoyl-CoA hydratase-related protein n=1 Tax=Georgenia sp. TF02-10 TaxID=2917725 RepID=UPI001FA745B0|nr:enoyl-CoA hydratase-related protein [Georgenia sp. TF02-10]UNX55041.1 enoyl-CoA hydratase-related protein [Georgenia sp. TF02-10]